MNISCLQENFSAALSVVRSGIGKESGLPILSTILIRAEGKLIYLNATNLEIAVQCSVRGKVENEGSVAIPAKTLIDFITLLPKEKIEIKTINETHIEFLCGHYNTKILGLNPEEFPLISPSMGGRRITCTKKELRNALAVATHAATQQETRPELHGVYLSWNGGNSTGVCVGTDAYRLAEKAIHAKDIPQENTSCIIPLRTAQELSRTIISDDEDICEVIVTDNQVCVKTETIECISKVVQGTFPDYKNIIPQNFHTKVSLERDELIRAVKATSLFSRSGLYDINCVFEPVDGTRGRVILSSANTQVGENTVVLDAEMTGGENTITLNYRYLLDGLNHIETPTVTLSLVDTQSPCVIRPAGKDDLTYLIMPIRE